MTAQRGFQCPACGADFDVQDRLEDEEQEQHTHAESGYNESGSATCPNCGSDVNVGGSLGEADVLRS